MTFAEYLVAQDVDVETLSVARMRELQTAYEREHAPSVPAPERTRRNKRNQVELMLLVPSGDAGFVRAFSAVSDNTKREKSDTWALLTTRAEALGFDPSAKGVKRIIAVSPDAED